MAAHHGGEQMKSSAAPARRSLDHNSVLWSGSWAVECSFALNFLLECAIARRPGLGKAVPAPALEGSRSPVGCNHFCYF